MKINYLITAMSLIICLNSCKDKENPTKMTDTKNPLLADFNTPYGVPPFDIIKDEHYKPALEEAMKIHKAEIDKIANQTEPVTFANTIEALDNSGQLLNKIALVFYNMSSAHTNDVIKAVEQEMAPVIASHYDYISLNKKLFQRVKQLYDQKGSLNLEPDQLKLLDDEYKGFIRSGVMLEGKENDRIQEINKELSGLTVTFGQNVLNEINAWSMVVDKKEELSGLPENVVEEAAAAATADGMKGKWKFGLSNPTVMPFLQYADNRDLRFKIWDAYSKKGQGGNENDNQDIIKKIVNLRLEKANLLGYESHAHYVLEDRMAKTPGNVDKLLQKLWPPTVQTAAVEEAEINAYIKKSGGNFKCEPHDWRYYAEKIRIEKYNLDENEVKQYFQLENVHKGVFGTVEKLWGLKFKERKDLPTYHPEAIPYEVTEANGDLLGILYMDFHPRESKTSGAWMTSFADQKMVNGKRVPPIISIVCNFTKPSGNTPALLTFDEVSTYFHEFGHALHGLMSNVRYSSQAGTNTPTDFVELPSMIMENWATEPEVLKMFAKHYKTGEIIPESLVQKIKNAGKYGQGFATAEYLASTKLDLGYHQQTKIWEGSAATFEKDLMKKEGLISSIIPRHSSTYFNHIFSGGYSAGYYSYIWSEVLDSDAYQVFKSKGIFDQSTASSFRENILSKGGTADAMELYKKFRGQEPTIDPLLLKRGFKK